MLSAIPEAAYLAYWLYSHKNSLSMTKQW